MVDLKVINKFVGKRITLTVINMWAWFYLGLTSKFFHFPAFQATEYKR